MTTFADRLKEAMTDREFKQTDLSRITGLDKSLISNYLSGKYKAKQDNLHLIALALDVSETWLMGYDVPKERHTPTITENNGRMSEFIKLFGQLTANQQSLIIAQIKGILSNQ